MSVVKATDVAYVRFSAPDLDEMSRFLLDFGMIESMRTPDRLFMRGYGASPFAHVTERGEPGFKGLGVWVRSEDDLNRLADHDRASVEALDAPGGGKLVRLTDPDGFVIEAVAGQSAVEPIETPPSSSWNEAERRTRLGAFRRVPQGPSHVRRLGHVVLAVSDFRRSEEWYKSRFGLLTSDEIQLAPHIAIGAFLRCDRGATPCDHHTIFLMQRPGPPGFMHAAFEVSDFDDLMAGHDHLERAGRRHLWGIGRHYLGSQVFDYWLDPWGHEVEHWTDGDLLAAADGGGIGSIQELMGVQWGMEMPPLPGAPPEPAP